MNGQPDAAERAEAARYRLRDLERATSDGHLAPPRKEPRLRNLVGPAAPGGISRPGAAFDRA